MQAQVLIADYANLTADGKLNVMGIFRQINPPRFPWAHPLMHIIVRLQPELGENLERPRTLTIKLLDEDAIEIISVQKEFHFPNRTAALQPEFTAIMGMNNARFPHPGSYEFVVLVDGEHKGAVSLYLNQAPARGGESPQSPPA